MFPGTSGTTYEEALEIRVEQGLEQAIFKHLILLRIIVIFMGVAHKAKKVANSRKNDERVKEGMKEGAMKVMNLMKLFADIKTAKRVILIEDHPGYAREIKNKIIELNPIIEILTARTLEGALKLKYDVDKETVVLSDYNFPITDAIGQMPQPLARKTYDELAEWAKAYAIVTLADSLDEVDKDLECFKVGKDEFIGEKRAEEMRKKKVIIAAIDELFGYDLIRYLRENYKGYIFAAPGLDRTDYIPVEVIFLAGSKENEAEELKIIKEEFANIFGREFDEKLHKSTIYAEDIRKE